MYTVCHVQRNWDGEWNVNKNRIQCKSHKHVIYSQKNREKCHMFKIRNFYHWMKNISSFWIWWQQHLSKKLGQGKQKNGKVSATEFSNMRGRVSLFCKKLQIYKLWDNFRIMFFSVKASETPVYNLYASLPYTSIIFIVR